VKNRFGATPIHNVDRVFNDKVRVILEEAVKQWEQKQKGGQLPGSVAPLDPNLKHALNEHGKGGAVGSSNASLPCKQPGVSGPDFA
jgi:hypothetical protein